MGGGSYQKELRREKSSIPFGMSVVVVLRCIGVDECQRTLKSYCRTTVIPKHIPSWGQALRRDKQRKGHPKHGSLLFNASVPSWTLLLKSLLEIALPWRFWKNEPLISTSYYIHLLEYCLRVLSQRPQLLQTIWQPQAIPCMRTHGGTCLKCWTCTYIQGAHGWHTKGALMICCSWLWLALVEENRLEEARRIQPYKDRAFMYSNTIWRIQMLNHRLIIFWLPNGFPRRRPTRCYHQRR